MYLRHSTGTPLVMLVNGRTKAIKRETTDLQVLGKVLPGWKIRPGADLGQVYQTEWIWIEEVCKWRLAFYGPKEVACKASYRTHVPGKMGEEQNLSGGRKEDGSQKNSWKNLGHCFFESPGPGARWSV